MIWIFKFLIFLFYYVAVTVFLVYLYINNAINFFELNVFSSSFPSVKHNYDVIIVGGGTAGLTIAAGLKEENVLIIEAGADFQSSSAPISSSIARIVHNIPILTPLLQFQELFDWQFKTQPQKYACKSLTHNVSHWPTGKGFGGTQLINNMIYERGHEDDYRHWFDTTIDKYNFTKDILPYFRKFEEFLELSELRSTTKVAEAFIQSKSQIFSEQIIDFKLPKVVQNNGQRWSVVDSYHLCPQTRHHHILSDAKAERILFDGDATDTSASLKAVGVRYRKLGHLYEVRATKAVILTGGTIGTPTLLLKSGIGSEHLYTQNVNKTAKKDSKPDDPLKIKLQKHLPAVGQHLQDHVTTGLDLITLNQSIGLEPWSLYGIRQLSDYLLNGQGPWTMAGCEGIGFVRTKLASNESHAPDLGLMLIPMGSTIDGGVYFRRLFNINERTWKEYFQPLIATPTVSILPIVLHPKSRGFVSIRLARDDDVETIIQPHYLSHPDDVEALVIGLKFIDELTKTPAFQSLGATITQRPLPGCTHLTFLSDKYWRCYARHLTLTSYHPVGTCRMGHNHTDSVVDPSTFRVHGVDQLYICDASIMPSMPSANPQSTVGMLAQKFLHSFYAQKSNDNHHATDSFSN